MALVSWFLALDSLFLFPVYEFKIWLFQTPICRLLVTYLTLNVLLFWT